MVGDMFNQGPKHRVEDVFNDLWASDAISESPEGQRGVLFSRKARLEAVGLSLFVLGAPRLLPAEWLRQELGIAVSTGAQNELIDTLGSPGPTVLRSNRAVVGSSVPDDGETGSS